MKTKSFEMQQDDISQVRLAESAIPFGGGSDGNLHLQGVGQCGKQVRNS